MITIFRGKYGFLSNFYPSPIEWGGKIYPTVEHAYQAAKTKSPEWREAIRTARHPRDAKRLGAEAPLRVGWDELRIYTMRRLVRKKFKDPELRRLLLATGDQKLVEGNYWNDTFWGDCNGVGENHLGRILMELRANIRQWTEKKNLRQMVND